jgi:nucleotide-binding universal stress UspA family protein
MVKKILVPIDFSSDSINALEFAIEIANKSNAIIDMIYVKSSKTFDVPFFFKDSKVNKVSIENFFDIILSKYATKIKTKLSYKIREGKVYREIINQAKYSDSDLIIMGTHGVSGFEAYWIGSNAYKVVSNSTCPVITIRNGFLHRGINKIVMPIDVSKCSRQKSIFTSELALLCDATIHLVSVRETNRPVIINKLNNYINQTKEYLESKNIKVITADLSGSNITDITIDYAKKIDAQLISIMTEQPENAYNIWLGKYAQQMVNNSPIPVLSIRPK